MFGNKTKCSQKQFGECWGTRQSVVRSSLVNVGEQDKVWSEAVVWVFGKKTKCRQKQFDVRV